MARLNLLPWRAELRKQRQKDFANVIIAAGAIVVMGMIYVHMYIGSMIDYQSDRNRYLGSEIAVLDKRIQEINEVDTQKQLLISKMNVIQTLQVSRPGIVHLFEEIARSVPEGVHIVKLVQNGKNLSMDGVAQSNARVSAYMRNLGKSPWLTSPNLNIIKTSAKSKYERLSRFTLKVIQSDGALAGKADK